MYPGRGPFIIDRLAEIFRRLRSCLTLSQQRQSQQSAHFASDVTVQATNRNGDFHEPIRYPTSNDGCTVAHQNDTTSSHDDCRSRAAVSRFFQIGEATMLLRTKPRIRGTFSLPVVQADNQNSARSDASASHRLTFISTRPLRKQRRVTAGFVAACRERQYLLRALWLLRDKNDWSARP